MSNLKGKQRRGKPYLTATFEILVSRMWLSVATGLNWCVEMVAAGSNWRLEINGGRCVAEDFLPAEIVLAEWSGCRADARLCECE